MARVLLADNDQEALAKWARTLRQEGYEVVEASSTSMAEEFLKKGGLDLAILDLHMERDDDEDDESGLRLAQAYREDLPVIMLTGLPTIGAALESLRRDGKSSPAVEFIRKQQDGPRALLKAMREAIVPRVFVVHGHDNEAALLVERFLDKIGTQPVVLRDLPGSGKAIIEKLERYANVSFAVVLLTPDDFGGKKADAPSSRSRARQNVIFELGYFIGRLGRSHVAILRKDGEDLEFPSDYLGIEYILMDAGKGWQVDLADEMREAGIEIEL